jgi:hypothetical protein
LWNEDTTDYRASGYVWNNTSKGRIAWGMKCVILLLHDCKFNKVKSEWQNFSVSLYTAISIKVVHEQSGKVEYERERLLGIANKWMNFQSDSQQPFALVFDFSALLVDNLNWNSCIAIPNGPSFTYTSPRTVAAHGLLSIFCIPATQPLLMISKFNLFPGHLFIKNNSEIVVLGSNLTFLILRCIHSRVW